MFITVGMLLHWRPKRFLRSVAESVPAVGGVLIQFPFYAVDFWYMIAGTGITKWLADLFVSISTHGTYPLLVAFYSALLVYSFRQVEASGLSKLPIFCRLLSSSR